MDDPLATQGPVEAPDGAKGTSVLWRELPYLVALVMTMIGVAYTSASP